MLKAVKFLRKLFVALLFMLSSIVLATGVYCYQYQDQIIQKFLEEAKKQFKNPIHIGDIQLTALKTFPHIGLVLQEVIIKNHTKSAADLMTAREVHCAFNVWKLLHGQYLVSHLSLAHGKLYWRQDEAHQLAWERDKRVAQQKAPFAVHLDKIELKDMEIVYGVQHHRYNINASQMQARLRWESAGLEADLHGKATIRSIQLGEAFAQDLPILVQATLYYDRSQKAWDLQPAQISYGNSSLTLRGSWGLAGQATALKIQGRQVSPHLLVHCLPVSYYQEIKPYDLRGQLNLHLSINKSRDKDWVLKGDFWLGKGALAVSSITKPIFLDKLKGSLHVPQLQDLSTASLNIQEISGTLAQSELTGHATLSNFQDPQLQCTAKSTIDLASLSSLLANAAVTQASGKLVLSGNLATHLRQLRRGLSTKGNLRLSGTLQAQNLRFTLLSGRLPCKELNGSLVFQDNDWAFKDVAGSLGPGSFVLNGKVQNILPYMLDEKQQCHTDARLYMDYLDVDALLDGKAQLGTKPTFNIAPQWSMNLACDIQQLHFRRFQGKNVRGRLKIKDRQLIADKLCLGIADGKASLDGVLDTGTEQLKMHTSARLQGVQLNKLFYMFENFHQNFLMDRHLSGEVFSDFDLTMQANKYWKINKETIEAAINVRLHNGALHHFEPAQQLNKYVDRESLAKLRFSELKNHIRIKNQTIHIPPMEVHSNITRIQVAGTHTFGGQIAYNFVVPLTGFQQQDRSGVPEAVGEDVLGGINLFLQLRGDVNNYELTYNATALKNSLKGNLWEQGAALKGLFQGKYEKKSQLQELAPDAHFDFE